MRVLLWDIYLLSTSDYVKSLRYSCVLPIILCYFIVCVIQTILHPLRLQSIWFIFDLTSSSIVKISSLFHMTVFNCWSLTRTSIVNLLLIKCVDININNIISIKDYVIKRESDNIIEIGGTTNSVVFTNRAHKRIVN